MVHLGLPDGMPARGGIGNGYVGRVRPACAIDGIETTVIAEDVDTAVASQLVRIGGADQIFDTG